MIANEHSSEVARLDGELHLAGRKIEAYRIANGLKRGTFAEMIARELGREEFPVSTIYNWERRGKDARPPLRKLLQDWGVCTADDWLYPAGTDLA